MISLWKMRVLISILATVLVMGVGFARVKTTRSGLVLKADASPNLVVETPDAKGDSLGDVRFKKGGIVIKGFCKRASDRKESFFVTNNTGTRITGIKLQIRYTDMEGKMLHQRNVDLDCDLEDKQTEQVTVKSFDAQRAFYYYGGDKPRKKATAFKVQMHVISYDVPVINPGNVAE